MVMPSEVSSNQAARVLVGLPMQPPEQGRLSVLFRLILTLPLMVVMALMAIVAVVVLIISWFAALITGRVPEAFQDFLVGYLRMSLNIEAYYFLLVPKWPGLQFNAGPSNQVTLEIDHVELNRAAVLFRLILAIPAHLLQALVLGLYELYLFIMWLVGIFTKKTPVALHQTLALILRYSARTSAYYMLLTPTQPFEGVFGDAAESGPSDKPTGWVVVPSARTLLVLSMVAGVLIYILVAATSGGTSQPTPY